MKKPGQSSQSHDLSKYITEISEDDILMEAVISLLCRELTPEELCKVMLKIDIEVGKKEKT